MRNILFLACAAALLFAAAAGCALRWRTKRRPKRAWILLSLALAAAVLLRWMFPAWSFPETTGPWKAVSAACTYTDENRPDPYREDGSARWLNTVFWYPDAYPEDPHSCPLVVFSHGAFGVKESNTSLYRELASHGYVVCAVDHTYHCLSTQGPDGKKVPMSPGYRRQVLSANDRSEKGRAELVSLFGEWMDLRMGDINFIIDTVKAKARNGDPGEGGVYLLTDPEKIAVIGHSLGGAAALGVGRLRGDIGGVIALEAPFMADVLGVKEGGFVFRADPYPVPLLSVYTDSSWALLPRSPQYALNYAMLNDRSDRTEDLYVRGAGHLSLTDLAFSSPPLCLLFGQNLLFDGARFVQTSNGTYLSFLDACFRRGPEGG